MYFLNMESEIISIESNGVVVCLAKLLGFFAERCMRAYEGHL